MHTPHSVAVDKQYHLFCQDDESSTSDHGIDTCHLTRLPSSDSGENWICSERSGKSSHSKSDDAIETVLTVSGRDNADVLRSDCSFKTSSVKPTGVAIRDAVELQLEQLPDIGGDCCERPQKGRNFLRRFSDKLYRQKPSQEQFFCESSSSSNSRITSGTVDLEQATSSLHLV